MTFPGAPATVRRQETGPHGHYYAITYHGSNVLYTAWNPSMYTGRDGYDWYMVAPGVDAALLDHRGGTTKRLQAMLDNHKEEKESCD